jgi:uncharacterized protein
VIVPDANLLLYAYDSSSTQHAKAKAWVENTLSGEDLVGLPWQTAGAFLRIVTNTKLTGQRMSLEEAASVIDQWLEQPNVRMLAPGSGHWPLFRQLMISGQAQGPLMTDAQLAALTIEHGGVLHTTDRDFTRFPGLRCVNPLTA